MSALKFALGIALSPHPRHRWRQLCVTFSAALAAVFCVLSFSLVHAFGEAWERGADRGAIPSQAVGGNPDTSVPDDAVALLAGSATLIDGGQVSTQWIQPLSPHDPRAIPPGLTALPEPGTAVLSPALIEAGYRAEDFGWGTSHAGSGPQGTIGTHALMTPSERLIWVRPHDGATLTTEASAYYIQGFGPSGEEDQQFPAFVSDPDVLDSTITIVGVCYLLVLPALILLVSGVRARSDVRANRMRVMTRIGISDKTIRCILGLESGVLAVLGATAGTLMYVFASPFFGKIPGTRLELAPGSLIPPWWACIVSVGAVTIAAIAIGMLGRLHGKPSKRRRSQPSAVPVVILVCALAVVALSGAGVDVLGSVVSSAQGLTTVTFIAGAFAAVIAAPLSVPFLAHAVTSRFTSPTRPALWAAAKRITAEPVRHTRLASVLAGLIVLVGVAASAWTVSSSPESLPAHQETASHAVVASWIDNNGSKDAFTHLNERLKNIKGGALALEIIEIPEVEGEPTPNKVHVRDCASTVTFLKGDPASLCTPRSESKLNTFVQGHTGYEVASTTEAKNATARSAKSALVLTHEPRNVPAMQKHLGSLTALTIEHINSDVTALLPLQLWMAAGIVAALIPLSAAIAREIGDESQADAERDAHYLRLGLSTQHVNAIAWAHLAIPIVVGATMAAVSAEIIAYSGQPVKLTEENSLHLSIILMIALSFTVLSTLIAWPARLSARRA